MRRREDPAIGIGGTMDLYILNNINFTFASNQGFYNKTMNEIYVGNIPRSDAASNIVKNKLPSILGLDFLQKNNLKIFFDPNIDNALITDEAFTVPISESKQNEIRKIIITDEYTIDPYIEDCSSCLRESPNNRIIIEGSGYQISKAVDVLEILKSRSLNLLIKIEISTIRINNFNRSTIKIFITEQDQNLS